MQRISEDESSETLVKDINLQTQDLVIKMEEINNIRPVEGLKGEGKDPDITDNKTPQIPLNRKRKSNKRMSVLPEKTKRQKKTPRIKRKVSTLSNEDMSEEEGQDEKIITGLNKGQVDSTKSSPNVSDVEDSSDSVSQQNHDDIRTALLTKILTIPLIRIDDARIFKANKITPKFSVVGDSSKVQTYIFEEEHADFVTQEVKKEPSVDTDPLYADLAEQGSNSDSENNEPEEQSSSSDQEDADRDEETRQSSTVRVVSRESWAESPRPGNGGDFTTFLQNTDNELRAMPIEDALELQAQMQQLIQIKRLSVLQRRTDDIRNNARRGQDPLQTSILTAIRNKNHNSSIIYMKYDNDDDEDAPENDSSSEF